MFSFFPFIMTVSGYNNELPLSPFNKETLRLERERVLRKIHSLYIALVFAQFTMSSLMRE